MDKVENPDLCLNTNWSIYIFWFHHKEFIEQKLRAKVFSLLERYLLVVDCSLRILWVLQVVILMKLSFIHISCNLKFMFLLSSPMPYMGHISQTEVKSCESHR